MTKNEIIGGAEFKSSYAVNWYDEDGDFHRGLFNSRKDAVKWAKKNNLKGSNRLK